MNQDGADAGDNGLLVRGEVFSYDIWANLLTIGGVTGYGAGTQGSATG